jgi:hypothetical protein
MAKRQQKSERKATAKADEVASPPAAPQGHAAEVGASHLLELAVDPFANKEYCWGSAVQLFHKVKEHHGVDLAKRMFLALAEPSKRRRKVLKDETLWSSYELLQTIQKGWGRKRAARHFHCFFRGEYGATEGAIEKRLKMLHRERRKK